MTFGDHDPEDSFDSTAPPDAEQVARKLHAYRYAHAREDRQWDDLDAQERFVLILILTKLLDWLRREGALRG